MNINYPTILEQLRHQLALQNISVLVGAGFSKNAHPKLYPSWWQLLVDMVAKINEGQYALDFENKTGKKPEEAKEDYSEFLKEKVGPYIEQTGYLQVVSNYVKKMGYREAVDVYIEEHTPIAERKDGKIFLKHFNGETYIETEIAEEALSLHAKLIKLPWNNIYTTNYDNLLEICIKEDQILGLKKLADSNNTKIDATREELNIKRQKLDSLELGQQNDIISHNAGEATIGTNRNQLINERYSLEFDIEFQQQQLQKLIEKKRELEAAINGCYSIIYHSSDLAIKKSNNIIKLHGSLPRDPVSDVFSFDNEHDRRYIISSEDYDNYPSRHEAFTQMMRISLLQGYFCLVGFSGDDPNFMAWVSWIRSVIMKSPGATKEAPKIFLIDALAKTPAPRSKQQFYTNHRIVHIPLSHPDCIEFLEKETKSKIDSDNTREVLNKLLDYLSTNSVINESQIAYELASRETYEQIMDLLPSSWKEIDQSGSLIPILDHYTELSRLRKFSRIPSIDHKRNDTRLNFLSNGPELYDIYKTDVESEKTFLGLFALICEDFSLPYSTYLEQEAFQKLVAGAKNLSSDLHYSYLKLLLKDAIWKAEDDLCQQLHNEINRLNLTQYKEEKPILLAMQAAVSLQFSELKKLVSNETPTQNNAITLSGFLGQFSTSSAATQVASVTFELTQQYLYSLELRSYLSGLNVGRKEFDIINSFKQAGLKSLLTNLDFALSVINRRRNKVEPLESDDSIGRQIVFSNSNDNTILSIQALSTLLEFGIPLATKNVVIKNRDDMYSLLREVRQRFPLPALFFAFQYNDSKFIKRLGQDFIYSGSLEPAEEVKILRQLTYAFQDTETPVRFRESILSFLSQFILILDPHLWENFFLIVWKGELASGRLFGSDVRYEPDFIRACIRHCEDAKILVVIINDCLEQTLSNDNSTGTAVNYLFQLSKNPFHKKNSALILKKLRIDLLNQVLDNLNHKPDYLFIAGNLHTFLGEEHFLQIQNEILRLDFNKIVNSRIWPVIVHFAGDNDEIKKLAISKMLESSHLWENGIRSDSGYGKKSFSYGTEYLELRIVRKNSNEKIGLEFSADDVLAIFNSLKLSLNEIKEFKSRLAEDFFRILQEMFWFLDCEINNQLIIEEAREIKDELGQIIFHGNEQRYIIQCLTSQEFTDINNALSQISRTLYDKGITDIEIDYLNMIVHKIQLKSGPGIILCLEYITNWCENFRTDDKIISLHPDLMRILDLFQEKNYPQGLNEIKIEQLLVRLAIVLDDWNIKSESISHFMDLLQNSRYISVRSSLQEKIRQEKAKSQTQSSRD